MEFDRESLDREFPSRRIAIQMNHAAVCPLPARAAAALTGYAERISTRGPLDYRDWIAEASVVRRLASTLIGAGEPASISIVPNTTSGLDLVASGFPWRDGDTVVTTDTEFPANLAPWLALAPRGVVTRRVPTHDGAFTAADVAASCDASTRVVCVSAVSFHTGFRAPIEELAAFCRGRGIAFGLDGIQAAGVMPLDVAGWGVDFLSADGHKWLLGSEGCGILYTAPELRARLAARPGWTNMKRRHPTDYRVPEVPEYVTDGTRFEVGALPTPGVYALAASLALLLEIGIDTVAKRVAETLDVLVRGLPASGLTPVLFGERPQAGILAARPPDGVEARHVARRLEERGIVVTAREGFVRFSPHVGNDVEEAARVVAALQQAAQPGRRPTRPAAEPVITIRAGQDPMRDRGLA